MAKQWPMLIPHFSDAQREGKGTREARKRGSKEIRDMEIEREREGEREGPGCLG